MGQEKHTFDSLPPGARLISIKDGERIAEQNGITLIEISKEKKAKERVPTIQEALAVVRIAKPKVITPP